MHSPSQLFSPQISGQPPLLYFISRPNGVLVPLIPADELPFNVRLQGVSRVLRIEQTQGMHHIHTAPYTGRTFKLEHDVAIQWSTSQPQTGIHRRGSSDPEVKQQFSAPDALARQAFAYSAGPGPSNTLQAFPHRQLPSQDLSTNWRKVPTSGAADKTQADIDAIVGSNAGAEKAAHFGHAVKSVTTPPPSGLVPDQDKKEFCWHWIRTGECDYVQQGCLYKHEMPSLAMLKKKIGWRSNELPRWWTEKTNIRGTVGEKVSVGPKLKVSEWLGQRKDSGSDNGNDADAGADSEASRAKVGAKSSSKPTKMPTTRGSDAVATASVTEATVNTPIHPHKLSVTGDLIDIAPLDTNTPATSTYTPLSSADASPAGSKQITPTSTNDEVQQDRSVEVRPSRKVFVPAGESPEKHVAESEKRATRNRSGSKDTKEAPAIDTQIQCLQKTKYNDLMASRHAPPTEHAQVAIKKPKTATKHAPKVACRVRRPPHSTASRAHAPEGSKE